MLYCSLLLFTVIACVEAKPAHHEENPIYSVFYHSYSKPLVLSLSKAEEDLLRKAAPPKAKTSNLMNLALLSKDKYPKMYEKVMEYKIERQERKDLEASRPEKVRKFIDDRTIFFLQKDVKKAFPAELQKAAIELSKMDDEEKKALLEYYPNLKIVTESVHFKAISKNNKKASQEVKKLIDEFSTYKIKDNLIVKD
uniref:DUF4476 domain-containing protein n=1 Tax=Steinernema glaseri TaxID=37863 RepID=A0A1I8ATF8_9BILA